MLCWVSFVDPNSHVTPTAQAVTMMRVVMAASHWSRQRIRKRGSVSIWSLAAAILVGSLAIGLGGLMGAAPLRQETLTRSGESSNNVE